MRKHLIISETTTTQLTTQEWLKADGYTCLNCSSDFVDVLHPWGEPYDCGVKA